MTAILVATLGTRDLMFQISSGLWYSIGDFTERVQVINDLGLDEKITHRDLTQYLSDRLDRYLDRIKPVIMGKLLTEQATQTEQMYPIYSKPELPGIGANFMYFRHLLVPILWILPTKHRARLGGGWFTNKPIWQWFD